MPAFSPWLDMSKIQYESHPISSNIQQILLDDFQAVIAKKAALNKEHNCQKCENYNESRSVCEPIPDCLGLGPMLKEPVVSPAPTPEGTLIVPAVKNNPLDTKTIAIALGVGFLVWYLLNNKKD